MRAVEIRIHNFRSIHDATIKLEPLSLIAGANNAGKSNVIDAIRLFYGDPKWDQERDVPKVAGVDTEAWVEVEFQPTDDELAQLKDDYKSAGGTFRVRNYVSPGPDGRARSGYYAYENEELSANLFYGARNVGSGKVGHIVYIPAVSKVDDNTKLTGPSALRELVAEVLNKVLADSPAYQKLTDSFKTFGSSIRTQVSADGQSLESLEAEITEEIASWDTSFSFGIQSLQPDEILKNLIKLQFVDETHGGEIDQARFGAGFQRHLIYTLIKLAAAHANPQKVSSGDRKEFSPQLTWILFEEPEAFLHPSQEEVLCDSLLKLVKDGATQVLLTTHSSRFVSRSIDDLTRLVHLRRDAGVTTAYQLSKAKLGQIFEDALIADETIRPISTTEADVDKPAMMASLKTELWMQATRTTAFFSERVILVEGASEVAVYSYLTTRGLLDPPARGLAVIDCLGKFNIHRFMAILGAFGIDHSVLYDGDNGGSHDAEVRTAIENATTDFTKRVTRFKCDLETELGITPLPYNQSSRKPQYALYNLESGHVDEAKIDALKQEFVYLATEP